jgi:hypothetical protein
VETTTRQAFQARCTQVAAIIEQTGATVAKAPKEFAVVVARGGASVSFPIVTDPRDWRETTPDEALYAALTDLFAWASAHTDDAVVATLDATEKEELPAIRRDLGAEVERLRALAQIVGGMDPVRRAWQAAGIDAAAASAIE